MMIVLEVKTPVVWKRNDWAYIDLQTTHDVSEEWLVFWIGGASVYS